MRVAITGSDGFIGTNLIKALETKTYEIRKLVRFKALKSEDTLNIGNISSKTDWSHSLKDIDCIIHCAGLAHNLKTSSQNLNSFKEINVLGTLNLAEQAVKAGVSRLVFLSSVKVNGDKTYLDKPFLIGDAPNPEGAYANSKWEAEKGLHKFASKFNLEIVIIRAPLVYGPGVKANFLHLLKGVSKGLPMPLSSLKNKRSFISIDNLVSVLVSCIEKPQANGETFFVSDDFDISTTFLVESLAALMNRPSRLFYLPKRALHLGGLLSRKENLIQSLIDSLQVDISHTKKVLNWAPQYNFEEGLKRTVQSFLERHPYSNQLL